jgi:hypothetical protein
LALIAPRRLARLQLAEPGKAEPLEMPGHCGRAASGGAGDLMAGPALASQPDRRWCGDAAAALRPRTGRPSQPGLRHESAPTI